MIQEINFISIGDKKFFSFIHFSIKQVIKFYPTAKFYIYDWGFTQSQCYKIKSYSNTCLIDWKGKIDRINGYKSTTKIFKGSKKSK